MFLGARGQFPDVIPFDQREISVIIENDFCFAILENRVYSSASTAESALNPLISRDKLTIAVIETPLKSSHLNSPSSNSTLGP
jgi:hypothetical protein